MKTMETVDEMLDEIIGAEGGYVDLAEDRGGPTKYGITKAALMRFSGRTVSNEDVKSLSLETARDIYRKDYVTGLDKIKDRRLQHQLLDAAIHHGPKKAVILLQMGANKAAEAGLREDGIFGKATEDVVNGEMAPSIATQMCRARLAFVCRIVRDHPDQGLFLVGWVDRITRFLV